MRLCGPHTDGASLVAQGSADRPEAEHTITEYLTRNFHLTTSGNFSTPSLINTIDVVGANRVMFSTDYPYDDMTQASEWFDGLNLDESVRDDIGSGNARRLFGLPAGGR